MKRTWQHRFGFMSLLGIFAAIFLCSIVLFAYAQKHWQLSAYYSAYVSRFKTWVAERKHRINPVDKPKTIVANKTDNNPEPIHFEFYTALPNMQLSAAVATRATLLKDNNDEQKTAVIAEKIAIKPHVSNAFMNAEELEREFAREIKQESYMLQVGAFHSADAAEKQRKLLGVSGFTAHAIKTNVAGKNVYRVELGPYTNKNQIKMVRERLHKKGFSGVIRKVEIA